MNLPLSLGIVGIIERKKGLTTLFKEAWAFKVSGFPERRVELWGTSGDVWSKGSAFPPESAHAWNHCRLKIFQDTFDHDKGQKSAILGRRLHLIF